MVYGGDGLGRLPADEQGPGKAVFVPFVLEGEKVELSLLEQKRGFARGELQQVLEASAQRVSPDCPYFQRCGGCHYQHAHYPHQLAIKTAILRENLRRIAKLELECEVEVHPSPAWNYRNRTRLKVQTSPAFAVGYYRLNSHELLSIEHCPISSPLINRAIAALCDAGGTSSSTWSQLQEIELFANADDTELLMEILCAADTTENQAQALAKQLHEAIPGAVGCVAFKSQGREAQIARVAASGAAEITYQTRFVSYRVSARAFFQTNRHLVADLANLVTQGYAGRAALDLYAGVGLFSSVLSREFTSVIAVESSPISFGDLRYNSPANVKAVRAMSEQYLKSMSGRLQPDLVVVDPPRSGLGETVIHSLVTLGAPRITYVSCDPATLSRDLGGLLRGGYRVEQAHLVDLFPQTYHLESVFHLVR